MPDRPLHRVARALVGAQEWLAAAALVVMMLVVVADVAMRHLLGQPLRGSYDMVSFSLLIMVFFGMGGVIARGAEIAIDLVDAMLPARVVWLLKALSVLLTIAVIAFVFYAMIGPAGDAWRYKERSLELGLSVWMLWALAFAGMAGILVASVDRLAGFGTGAKE
ncbi:TRAP transporter small permease [Frigidibacter sp.]|uniref:TRAP transporter small permease n=1 Tax=Frigidibacter sp. TaxID=2586418 RepID=UPI002735E3D6|nr:TRAP transporter small permease [Frigidibacter sp.]MDP3342204.1 TRAP transporter small permease [Frigidibacter sp.]